MNYITTNIRFPEDMYMELKMEAAASRKSVAELVRNGANMLINKKKNPKKPNTTRLLAELDRLAKKNAKYFKGKSASEALIEMRYEQ